MGTHERYSAPIAKHLWSDESKAAFMQEVTDHYALSKMAAYGEGPDVTEYAEKVIKSAPPVDTEQWRRYEEETGHEIVGFLKAYLEDKPEVVHPWVHLEMTSSDLVEYATFKAMSKHTEHVLKQMGWLVDALGDLSSRDGAQDPRAGRTHGRTAEATTLGWQLSVQSSALRRSAWVLTKMDLALAKSPGATGYSPGVAHLTRPPEGLRWTRSTQIMPRDLILRWANEYLVVATILDKLALDVRLGSRSGVGELTEAGAHDRQGSSAMPAKLNPISSEKVNGLHRLVVGYHGALVSAATTWEDRDLSNSSTERVALPGLAGLVEHMLDTMIGVISSLEVNQEAIRANAQDLRAGANKLQSRIQTMMKIGPLEASKTASWMLQRNRTEQEE